MDERENPGQRELPVGGELRALILNSGRGLTEFARDAGVSTSQMYRIVSGRVPSARTGNKINRALGLVPLDGAGLKMGLDLSERLSGDTEIPLVVKEALARNLESHQLAFLTIAAVQQMEARNIAARAKQFSVESSSELRAQARRLYRSAAFWYGVVGDARDQADCKKAMSGLAR